MKTKKINLTITGCLGRMGQQLIKSASKDKRFKINSLTENKSQRKKILGILPKLNSSEASKDRNFLEVNKTGVFPFSKENLISFKNLFLYKFIRI